MNNPEVPEPVAPSGAPLPVPAKPASATPARPATLAHPVPPAGPPMAPKPGSAAQSGGVRPGGAAKPAKPAKPAKVARRAKPAKATTPGKRRGGKVLALVIAGVVLFGGGIWLGTAVTDPTASEEYAALDATAQTAEKDLARTVADRAAVSGELASLKSEITTREEAADTKVLEAAAHEEKLKTREANVKKREDAVTGAEKTKAANTIAEGTWTVGTDIQPGTYRAKAEVGSSCYWEITRTGSNGNDIVSNDIPSGGRPTVALAAGQDFNSARCGSWEKQ